MAEKKEMGEVMQILQASVTMDKIPIFVVFVDGFP